MDIFEKIIRSVDDFPTLPTIFSALAEVMTDPRSTFSDAANVISRDQASAMKILKVANSAFYGFPGKIDTISQAIFYIGFEEVKNIIITISIWDIFKSSSSHSGFNIVDLWKHSIGVGVASRTIAKTIKAENVENCFIAGIIHDIGKLLFIRYLGNEYIKVIDFACENNLNIRDAESDMLGITHTIAGELIGEKWKMPLNIKNAIRYHYSGMVNGKVHDLSAIVHIANIVVRMMQLGNPGDYIIPEPYPEVLEYLKIPHNCFSLIVPEIDLFYQESLVLFSL